MNNRWENGISRWMWVWYPLLTVFLVVGSIILWTSKGGMAWWKQFGQQKKEIEAQQLQLSLLKGQLDILSKVDKNVETANLEYLLEVVPKNVNVSILLGQLSQATGGVGAELVKFQGSPANKFSITATFKISDFNQLQDLLADLEKSLPLIEITQIVYKDSEAKIFVQQLTEPLGVDNSKVALLSDSTGMMSTLGDRLQEFNSFEVDQSATPGDQLVLETNPF